MNRTNIRIEPDRARAVGRMLFQKYDLSKRGVLEPKQCYEIFSDFCYRILNINSPPSMEESDSMHQVLDTNRDQRVTESDFENLAVKYLCGQSASNRYESRTTTTVTISKQSNNERQLNSLARRRLDVVKRLFRMFDRDNSGYLTQDEIPGILTETYKDLGQVNFKPSKQDVKSYMRMVDKNNDGRITLEEFEEIVLRSLEKAGFQIYE